MEVMSFLESKLGMTSDHSSIASMNLFVALLCACIIIGRLLEESRCESITSLLIGLCTGIIIMLNTSGKSSHLLMFSEDLFFIYLLPPIIFNAGHLTDREVALMMLMAYLSYVLADFFYLSAIFTVFFCGIVMSHYTWHNITESSRVTTKLTFATLSFVAEIFIFLYVGMDALDIDNWEVVL